VTDANALFQTTAARNEDLADVFRALPRFERDATVTLPQLTAFARRAQRVVERLQPAASAAEPLLADVDRLAPQFDGFFARLDEVVAASKRGLPAFDRILLRVPPLLEAFGPFLRNANPVLDHIGDNKREVTAFFANIAAASQIKDMTSDALHFLRTSQTLGPTAASFYPRPLGSTRLNPYVAPGTFDKLPTGLPVLDATHCGKGEALPPAKFGDASLPELLTKYGFRTEGRDIPAPTCTEQGNWPGFTTKFPQLRAEP
jgi:ABC-type transporter Mla subunit MlaD